MMVVSGLSFIDDGASFCDVRALSFKLVRIYYSDTS